MGFSYFNLFSLISAYYTCCLTSQGVKSLNAWLCADGNSYHRFRTVHLCLEKVCWAQRKLSEGGFITYRLFNFRVKLNCARFHTDGEFFTAELNS